MTPLNKAKTEVRLTPERVCEVFGNEGPTAKGANRVLGGCTLAL